MAVLLITMGCDAVKPVVFNGTEAGDFSNLGWVDAFDSMHQKMSREYAFTEWRGIDWEQKKGEFRGHKS